MNSFIRLEHISKTYKLGETAFHALRNISVSFESGTFCFVTGRSGSGKTTLLNLIGTLDKPTKGKIFLEGKDISILPDKSLSELRRRRIGFVFQAFNLLNEYSVWDNVCLSFYLDGAKPDRTYLEELLNTFGLWERRDSYPAQLSGGQQLRVAIARAMANHPAILLADEPTGNLDHRSGSEVMQMLRLSRERFQQTILLVTHDVEYIGLADRRIHIEDGRIVDDTQNAESASHFDFDSGAMPYKE